MSLHTLIKRKSESRKVKRVGRGYGSGKGGHTAGRGMKGQKSRSGVGSLIGFEGGNVPLHRRLPKYRGFKNPNRIEYEPVNIVDLDKHFKSGETVSVETLKEKGMIKHKSRYVKILGKGDLKNKLVFAGVRISSRTLKRLQDLGCEVK